LLSKNCTASGEAGAGSSASAAGKRDGQASRPAAQRHPRRVTGLMASIH
jgi:hypothetical protein